MFCLQDLVTKQTFLQLQYLLEFIHCNFVRKIRYWCSQSEPDHLKKGPPKSGNFSTKNSKLSPTWEVLFTNDPDEIVNTNILSYFSNKVTVNGL